MLVKNPKTTIAGYITLTIAVLTVVSHVLTAGIGGLGAGDIAAIMAALAGVGLIAASDGGH
jgi:hypothetical protein